MKSGHQWNLQSSLPQPTLGRGEAAFFPRWLHLLWKANLQSLLLYWSGESRWDKFGFVVHCNVRMWHIDTVYKTGSLPDFGLENLTHDTILTEGEGASACRWKWCTCNFLQNKGRASQKGQSWAGQDGPNEDQTHCLGVQFPISFSSNSNASTSGGIPRVLPTTVVHQTFRYSRPEGEAKISKVTGCQ